MEIFSQEQNLSAEAAISNVSGVQRFIININPLKHKFMIEAMEKLRLLCDW